jgi:protein TonB
MFEDATFHSNGVLRNQTPKWMLLTLSFNLMIVSAMIVLPLIYPDGLPAHLLQKVLYVPTPASAERTEVRSAQPAGSHLESASNPYLIPKTSQGSLSTFSRGDSASWTVPGDGLPMGDVIGADSLDKAIFKSAQPKVVPPAQTERVSVSKGVEEGLLLSKSIPVYPAIARATGTSGTVTLAATISKVGVIENLRVVSGNPMFYRAALDAVRSWRYRPYMLNDRPVEVETTINVVFSMNGR